MNPFQIILAREGLQQGRAVLRWGKVSPDVIFRGLWARKIESQLHMGDIQACG